MSSSSSSSVPSVSSSTARHYPSIFHILLAPILGPGVSNAQLTPHHLLSKWYLAFCLRKNVIVVADMPEEVQCEHAKKYNGCSEENGVYCYMATYDWQNQINGLEGLTSMAVPASWTLVETPTKLDPAGTGTKMYLIPYAELKELEEKRKAEERAKIEANHAAFLANLPPLQE
ncbi:hypothetical protein IQ07DRAFT_593895 [Pyrenochaeta sp. DS3sAY3a]|nr:hypothetical protein IQ07DRAFT_593895 [Pyrenochaeta sp. DS3sAY3a]